VHILAGPEVGSVDRSWRTNFLKVSINCSALFEERVFLFSWKYRFWLTWPRGWTVENWTDRARLATTIKKLYCYFHGVVTIRLCRTAEKKVAKSGLARSNQIYSIGVSRAPRMYNYRIWSENGIEVSADTSANRRDTVLRNSVPRRAFPGLTRRR